jgi:C4-dicarboxylate-specific signal transduction histidine kinase
MGYWSAFKAVLASWKLWASVAVALLIAVWSYQQGKASCQEKAYEALEDELERQQEQSARALKQAVKDAKSLVDKREKGNEQVEQARVAAVDSCKLSNDELHVLQGIREGTKVK